MRRLLISALLIIAAPLTGFVPLVGAAAPGPTANCRVVGLSVPLSGPFAEYGTAVKNGIELAKANHQNSAVCVSFVLDDNQYDPTLTVSSVRKLTTIDQAQLLYLWGEAPLNSVASILEAKKIPTLALAVDISSSRNKNYIVRSINPPADFAALLVNYFRKNAFKHIAIIKVEDPFQNAMTDAVKNHLESDENLSDVISVGLDDQDFRSIIMRLKRNSPDIIGVYLNPGQVANFYRQAKELGLSLPTFGTDIFESHSEVALSEGNMVGAVYPNVHVPENFNENYTKTFGNDIQLAYAYNAYDFAEQSYAVFANLEPTATPEQILSAYRSRVRKTAVYSETPEGDRYFRYPMSLRRVEKDRFVDVKP